MPKVLDTIAKLAEHNSDKQGYIVGDNVSKFFDSLIHKVYDDYELIH